MPVSARYDKSLLIAKMLRRLPLPNSFTKAFNCWRHQRILNDIEQDLQDALDIIRQNESPRVESVSDVVWTCWWQGLQEAPDCIRSCIETLVEHSGSREVIVITKNNVESYADFPDNIYRFMESGLISTTHFSDLLRYRLLSRRGGLWLDATTYAAGSLPELTSCSIYTCGGYSDPVMFNVSGGRWLGPVMGGPANHPMFRFMDTFFSLYWARRDYLIDYFLIDYATDFAWRNNIGGFADDCTLAVGRNPGFFALRPILNRPYSDKSWQRLRSRSSLFKISYKWLSAIKDGSFADVLLGSEGLNR